MVPNWKVTVVPTPLPIAAVLLACPAATSFCACARLDTSIGRCPPLQCWWHEAQNTLLSDEVVAVRVWNLLALFKPCSAVWKPATRLDAAVGGKLAW